MASHMSSLHLGLITGLSVVLSPFFSSLISQDKHMTDILNAF